MILKIFIWFRVSNLLALRPSVQFSSDEAIACCLATNEIQFFDARDFSKGIIYRVRIPGIASVELSKAPGSHVAAFIPESKVCVPLLNTYFWDGSMVIYRSLIGLKFCKLNELPLLLYIMKFWKSDILQQIV